MRPLEATSAAARVYDSRSMSGSTAPRARRNASWNLSSASASAFSVDAIFESGLNPGRRRQVHLSLDPETATRVGRRHGKPVVLSVDTGKMHADGHVFFRADNGVWLTDSVPATFLGFGIAQ